mgnify:CR=1 FL=1
MAFDTILTITWTSEADQIDNDIVKSLRSLLVERLKDEAKTDGIVERQDAETSKRYFIDASAATEFQTGLTQICEQATVTVPTFVIS